MLTRYVGDDQMVAALAAGASAFAGKGEAPEAVVEAVRHAGAGPGSFRVRDLGGALMWRMMARPGRAILSPRERQVLDLLLDDLTMYEVSRRLSVPERIVKQYTVRLFEKIERGLRP